MVFVVITMLLSIASCSKNGEKTLYIFNWSDYIDPSLIKSFEKEYNCKVKYTTYDSNENMLTKIKSSRESFDVVFPSGDHVSILSDAGLLEPLDKSLLKNYANIDQVLLDKAKSFDHGNEYSIPYFWGLTGLLYNKEYVPETVIADKSWNVIASKFFEGKNKVTMLDDAREVVGAALEYSGFNLNDTSDAAIKAATQVLSAWDKNITQFDSDSYKNEVPDGTTWLAQAYNGDALQQMSENSVLGFFLPVEGASMWMDSMVILKSSKNKPLAYLFIDYMLDAQNAKINAEYTQFATPNMLAYQMLDASVKGNELIYPSMEYLKKCHMIEPIGDEVKKIDSIFEQIKMY